MLVPFGSDAPLYHLPMATVAMILLNVLAYFGVGALEGQMSEEDYTFLVNQLILQYGTFKPWQWITSNFTHRLKPEDRQLVSQLRARARQLQGGHAREIVEDW